MIDCNHVSKDKWESLGLHLGLHKPTLNVIMANNERDAERCFRECLSKWLEGADDTGTRTRLELAKALESIGERAVAAILRKKCTEC